MGGTVTIVTKGAVYDRGIVRLVARYSQHATVRLAHAADRRVHPRPLRRYFLTAYMVFPLAAIPASENT
jgi:hypothetical protein